MSARTTTAKGSRSSRRRLILGAVAAVLLIAAATALLGFRQGRLSAGQSVPVGGRILLPSESGLAIYNLDSRRQTPLVQTSPGEIVSSVAASPDGSKAAYGFYHRRAGDPAGVSEIYLVGLDGSAPTPVAERDRPGAVLDMPVWSPDGAHLYFAYFGQSGGRAVQRVERLALAGGARETIVENGYAPAISPDGSSLLFLRDERAGTGLWLTKIDGGQAAPVVPPGRYPALAVPRFSPDGQKIATAIVNSSSASVGTQSASIAPWGGGAVSDLLTQLLLPSPAYAHGLPWDIWTFDLNGEQARRLTQVDADDPAATWSPDGHYIAFWGGNGLYLVGADGTELRQVLNRGSYGMIDWIP